MLTTIGRKSGKARQRCVRVIRRDDRAYLVAIKGQRTAWLKNIQANPRVWLRFGDGSFTGIAREPESSEREVAREAYCEIASWFEYLEYSMWRKGRPTATAIAELHRTWFENGTPLVVDLRRR